MDRLSVTQLSKEWASLEFLDTKFYPVYIFIILAAIFAYGLAKKTKEISRRPTGMPNSEPLLSLGGSLRSAEGSN
jgi:hypothetical protein